ncbi:MAG: hypothetical protein IPK65_06365 [Gammaproteobacteria bacterium]|nr:hypothetical protein [Gammaproteobacteria bacterium]
MHVSGLRQLACVAALCLPLVASAATYIAPSGYFQIVGYKLQRGGAHGLSVAGWVQALADCRGAELLFDVLDAAGAPVGTIRVTHGAFFRHDRWDLGPGEFIPLGTDVVRAVAAADRVEVRTAECAENR